MNSRRSVYLAPAPPRQLRLYLYQSLDRCIASVKSMRSVREATDIITANEIRFKIVSASLEVTAPNN